MEIILRPWTEECDKQTAVSLIQAFWLEHNGETQTTQQALQNLHCWTAEGRAFYLIQANGKTVGFARLGSRGAAPDWLEDLFVLSEYQGRGIGSQAIFLLEKIVSAYSSSMYIEVAARNQQALRLYRRLGFDCLNTLTIRKDFVLKGEAILGYESVQGLPFAITNS